MSPLTAGAEATPAPATAPPTGPATMEELIDAQLAEHGGDALAALRTALEAIQDLGAEARRLKAAISPGYVRASPGWLQGD